MNSSLELPAVRSLLTELSFAGLERTDNNMELSSWPQIAPINQKNYYTYVYPFRIERFI